MISLGLFRAPQWLFPQVGAEIVNQIGKMFPVKCPDWFSLKACK